MLTINQIRMHQGLDSLIKSLTHRREVKQLCRSVSAAFMFALISEVEGN